jgi:hypothetical protein
VSIIAWADRNLDTLVKVFIRLAIVVGAVMLLTVCTEITQAAYRMGYKDAKAGKPMMTEDVSK